MGSSLVIPGAENANEVRLIGGRNDSDLIDACRATNQHPKLSRPFPPGVSFYKLEQWREAVQGVDLVVGGVSSFGAEWFLREILSGLDPSVPVLSVTKGLVDLPDGSLISYPEYWKRGLADMGIDRIVAAIGGPCTAGDLVLGNHTEIVFCGENSDELRMMKEVFARPYYHISLTNDVRGTCSAAALKNAYALGVSMVIGLENKRLGATSGHYNAMAGAFYQATKEMLSLLRLLGCDDAAACNGIGDIFVTVYGGRTRELGILLGEGYSVEEALQKLSGLTLESEVVTRSVAAAVMKKAEAGILDLRDYPLLMHVHDVIVNHADPELPWESFTFEHLRQALEA